jgi:ankyrin repeat protein
MRACLLLFLMPCSLASMQKTIEKKIKEKTILCDDCTVSLGNAIRKNDIESVDLLLDQTIDLDAIDIRDTPTNKPLHLACIKPETMSIARLLLLKKRIKVNKKDYMGETAFHWAVRQQNIEAIVLLLDNGANPSITNKAGKKASYWPEKYGNLKLKSKY